MLKWISFSTRLHPPYLFHSLCLCLVLCYDVLIHRFIYEYTLPYATPFRADDLSIKGSFPFFFWFGGTLLFFFSKQMRPFSACLYVLDVYTHTHSLWCWWRRLFLNNYSTWKTGWFALVIFIDPTAQSYVNGKLMCAISPIATYRTCQKSNETKKNKGGKKYWSAYVYIFTFLRVAIVERTLYSCLNNHNSY
jgi:hypothetical protein